jgi:hypothetical protein
MVRLDMVCVECGALLGSNAMALCFPCASKARVREQVKCFRVFGKREGDRFYKLIGRYGTLKAAKDRAEWIHINYPGAQCRIRVPKAEVSKWANQSFAHTDTMSLFPRFERFSEEGPRWTFLSSSQVSYNIYQ